MALMTSPIPVKRPSGLSRAVDTAVAAALKQPAQKQPVQQQPAAQATRDVQVVSDSTAASQPQEEPDLQTPAPDLPTNASVAKQATTRNALNTRRIALLAVFGTPSTRFAMIRQSNGAVKKVQVGDTMDGGRVAAISATTVQYQKGGQMVTLSLPTG